MTEEDRKAEDVAAVLSGKVKCPYCDGVGHSWFNSNPCVVCSGKRWVKPGKSDRYLKTNSSGPR
jgi:DnaJ-class molecular chaperone